MHGRGRRRLIPLGSELLPGSSQPRAGKVACVAFVLSLCGAAAPDVAAAASSAPESALAQTPSHALSLAEALALAHEQNPELLIRRARAARAAGEKLRSRQGVLPTVSLDATYLKADVGLLDGVPVLTPGSTPGLGFVSANPVEGNLLGVQLLQPLVNFEAWAAGRQAGHLEQAAQLGARRTRDEVTVATIASYFGASTAQRRVAAESRGLATARRALRQAEAALEEGLVSRLDRLQARTRVAEMEARVAAARSGVVRAHSVLRQVLGLDGEGLIPLADAMPEPPSSLSPGNHQVLERSDLRARKKALDAAQAGVERARAGYLPAVNLVLRYQRLELNQPVGLNETDWVLGVNLGWTIFAGYGRAGALDAAQAAEREARIELDALRRQARAEERDTRAEWQAQRLGWERARSSVRDAQEALQLTEARYAEGLDDMRTLLGAQAEVLAADSREINARYNALMAAQRYRLAVAAETGAEHLR